MLRAELRTALSLARSITIVFIPGVQLTKGLIGLSSRTMSKTFFCP